jgi:heme/copper-type cytochrome/quinol oxidase subunit 3
MFFLGLAGAFLVLRAGNKNLFAEDVTGLSQGLAQAGLGALLLSSVMMFVAVRAARRGSDVDCNRALKATLLSAAAFIGLRSMEYSNALAHHTIVARSAASDPLIVYDGSVSTMGGRRTLTGFAAPLPADFDPHTISQSDVAKLSQGIGHPKTFLLPADFFQDVRYGPGKNIFYATWFTLTGAHLVHAAAGLIAIGLLMYLMPRKRASAKHVEYVALYWQFVVLVGFILFPLMYLG